MDITKYLLARGWKMDAMAFIFRWRHAKKPGLWSRETAHATQIIWDGEAP